METKETKSTMSQTPVVDLKKTQHSLGAKCNCTVKLVDTSFHIQILTLSNHVPSGTKFSPKNKELNALLILLDPSPNAEEKSKKACSHFSIRLTQIMEIEFLSSSASQSTKPECDRFI